MGISWREEALDLLTKATQEQLAAELTAEAPGLVEHSLHHAGRAMEKALRGFLAAYGQRHQKAKNLPDLLRLCAAFNPAFLDTNLCGLDQAKTAAAKAKNLLDLVRRHLPSDLNEAR